MFLVRELHLKERRGQTNSLEITRKVIRLQIRSDKIPALISPIGRTTPFKQIRFLVSPLTIGVENFSSFYHSIIDKVAIDQGLPNQILNLNRVASFVLLSSLLPNVVLLTQIGWFVWFGTFH